MSWIDLIYIYFILTIVILAVCINISESNISPILLQTFRYGKHAYKGKPSRLVQVIEVPKSYFKHFYVFAIIWAILTLGLTFNVYMLGTEVPEWIIDSLDFLCGSDRVANGMCEIEDAIHSTFAIDNYSFYHKNYLFSVSVCSVRGSYTVDNSMCSTIL